MMDSISPKALGLVSDSVPLVAGSDDGFGRGRSQDPSLRRLLRFVIRWRWVLLGGIGAGVLLGLVITLLMTRQYDSTVRLEISRETARVTKIDGVERDTNIGDREFYQTQYGLLEATTLAERVARDLGVIDDPAFFKMFGMEDVFDETAGLARQEARRAKRTEAAGEILLNNITVSPVRGSSLVDVTATTPDPAMSRRIASSWARQFIDASLERRFEASAYARKFLESRIEALRGELEVSERRAVSYAANQGIINLPLPGGDDDNVGSASGRDRSLLTDSLGKLNEALAIATAERIDARSRLAASGNAGATGEALGNPAINELRRQRAEVAAEYAETSSQFAPGYPKVKALADKLRELDGAIGLEIGRVRQSLAQSYKAASARESALAARVEAMKGQLSGLRQRSVQYNIYLRDAETNRELYDSLLQRYKEIGVEGRVSNNNIAVINNPKVPDNPSRPSLLINLLLSMAAGGLIGVAAAAALNQIDEAISDPAEVREKLGLPLLGAPPRVKDESPLVELQNPRSPLLESYLAAQASLELSTPHGTPRSLALTSTRSQEGKSISAIALARSLARTKHKVILIDADMRAPSIHSAFGISNEQGVSNYLSGNDNLATAVHESGYEGLAVMPAGPQPPNTADLLTGNGLQNLIERLLESYDYVIVDSPPVLGLADAQLTAAAVEGTIYVVEAGTTQSRTIRNALDRLRTGRANLVGVLLTKFDPLREPFSYGYGYGYGYGYDYGTAKN